MRGFNSSAPPALDPPLHEFDLGAELGRWLGRVLLGPAQPLGTLEISPLVLTGEPGEPYLLLHEAIASGALLVTEQGEGNVSELVAHNRGDRPVLILEGESVAGASQNRVITMDILLAAGATATVFVGCVEQGRWDFPREAFVSPPMMVEPMMRAANKAESGFGGKINQSRLWRTVADKLGAFGVQSESSSYTAFMAEYSEESARQADVLAGVENQVGILALEGGRLVGLDVLGHPRNWSAVAHRLASSYVLGSLEELPDPASRVRRSREQWLAAIASTSMKARPAKGLGQQVVLSDSTFVGGGLWHDGRPAHLAVFGTAPATQPAHWVAQT